MKLVLLAIVWTQSKLIIIIFIQKRKKGKRKKENIYINNENLIHFLFSYFHCSIVAGITSEIDPVLVLSGVTSMEMLSQYAYRPYLILGGVYEIPDEDERHKVSESDMEEAARRVSLKYFLPLYRGIKKGKFMVFFPILPFFFCLIF